MKLVKGSQINWKRNKCDFCGKRFEEDDLVIRINGGLNFCCDVCRQYYFQRR